jgi:hypothetical protein
MGGAALLVRRVVAPAASSCLHVAPSLPDPSHTYPPTHATHYPAPALQPLPQAVPLHRWRRGHPHRGPAHHVTLRPGAHWQG